jgi:membrane-associated phospholipid phosphatase
MISRDTPANVIQSTPPPHERTWPLVSDARGLSLVWLGGFLATSAILLARSGHLVLAIVHAVVIAVTIWSARGRGSSARIVGDLLPLVVTPLLYGEIPLLIAAIGSTYHDALVAGWESRLFGGQPSRAMAGALPSVAVSELLHAGYLAYYPLIFVPPLLLFATARRRALHQTVLALTITYIVCWVIFAFFPVEGPRYLWSAPAGVPTGPFRNLAVRILAAGSSRGAAFPSSHMAVSTVQAVMAWRWQQRLAPAVSVIALLVGVGAVYGGFHYATDMFAGALLGALAGAFVWRRAE